MKQFSKRAAGFCGASILVLAGYSAANADQVILDDLIVDGSACIGQDCVNGESFSFDTLRLKENNLRIKFQDTSSTSSFPSNDWQLTANDSTNGGANKFSIDDITNARTPFTIEAGAPSHSLFVEDSGQVGIGTSNPVVELHVIDGDTPTLRLEQDGSSGFTPQTFDLAANETNFFIRDVTNGSSLPLRIRPGAPTSAIDIAANGNVGMGTSSPSTLLHLRGASDSIITLESTGGAAQSWEIKNNQTTGRLTFGVAGGTVPMKFDESAVSGLFKVGIDGTDVVSIGGDLSVSGTLTTSGSCSVGCDRVFSDEYELPTIEEHAAVMWEKNYLPNVGPTSEEVPFNIADKMGRMLNELEHAHIYIEQLHTRIKRLETTSIEQ